MAKENISKKTSVKKNTKKNIDNTEIIPLKKKTTSKKNNTKIKEKNTSKVTNSKKVVKDDSNNKVKKEIKNEVKKEIVVNNNVSISRLKREVKHSKLIIIIALIILVGVVSFLFIRQNNILNEIDNLKNNTELLKIENDKLREEQIDYQLLKLGYSNDEVGDILNVLSDSEAKEILNYSYFKDFNDIIKDQRFNKEYIKDYLDLLNDNKEIDTIFNEVNPVSKELAKCKYYLEKNLNKYLSYYEKNNKLSYDEVILRVNTHIDNEFYTNISKTDTSKGNLMIVNKFYKLSSGYSQKMSSLSGYGNGSLQTEASKAFKKMVDAAKKEGLSLRSVSSYRSYYDQKYLYDNYVKRDGTKLADTYSARAGHSEHQTGLAVDINTASSAKNFQSSKEYAWLIKNCKNYGFILRYPSGKTYITGYKYEPWHYRYVGVDAAKYIMDNNITYEEYYAYFVEK